jgi:large subunit ribosomal protein L16
MGKGKGDVDMYTARIKKGKVIVELSGIDRTQAEELFEKAGKKLSIRVKTVSKGEVR